MNHPRILRRLPGALGAALLIAGAAGASGGCSWSRFDDALELGPVEFVDRPTVVRGGFGTTLAGGDRALFVGGSPRLTPGALMMLGAGPPSVRGAIESSCDDATCTVVGAPVAVADRGPSKQCFIVGLGTSGPLGQGKGLVGSCYTGPSYKLPAPEALAKDVIDPAFEAVTSFLLPNVVALGADGDSLAVGSPDAKGAWVYPSIQGDMPPEPLPTPPEAAGSFGVAVAPLGPAAQLLVAVSAPTLARVYLFDAAQSPATPRACLTGGAAYGVVLLGFHDGPRRLLAISDGAYRVDVIDVDKIPPSPDCKAPPAAAILQQLGCMENDDVAGCAGSAFGASLAAADLDHDGDAELLVGAPGLNTRQAANSGGIQVFDLEGSTQPLRTLFLTSALANERVGTSLAVARVGDNSVVLSNAFVKQELLLFHCPTGRENLSRCQ
jgi:hypothetical protein